MKPMSRSELLTLLARARDALENPYRLDPADRAALAADIAGAHDRIAGTPARAVHVAAIQHPDGYDVLAAFERDRLDAMVARFCRERWHDTGDTRDPATLDDAGVARIWFDPSGQSECRTMEILDDGQGDTGWIADPGTAGAA